MERQLTKYPYKQSEQKHLLFMSISYESSSRKWSYNIENIDSTQIIIDFDFEDYSTKQHSGGLSLKNDTMYFK